MEALLQQHQKKLQIEAPTYVGAFSLRCLENGEFKKPKARPILTMSVKSNPAQSIKQEP
jgi:hypothetical protein